MKSAECVTPKHPDKLCDQISDAILDFCLWQDTKSRVAIEVQGGHGKISIMGEVTFAGILSDADIYKIVHRLTGYAKSKVKINIVKQSPEIAKGVDIGGAGDQGIMSGYACTDNDELMPQEYYLARSLCKFIYAKYPYDGKTEIILDDNNNILILVASFQKVASNKLLEKVNEWLSINNYASCEILCNPAGDWTLGGFDADTGVTGRKLMVDNYGPQIAIGGGAFSGKDATKVDRSAAYMARSMAVYYLKKFKAREVIVKIVYAIGRAEPLMVDVTVDGEKLKMYHGGWDLKPLSIIKYLKLREPIFEETAKWGHFGNGFLWDN